MKFKTFDEIINSIVELYQKSCDSDKRLEKALGGDTTVITDNVEKTMDRLINALIIELGDDKEDGWIDYLIYENMISHNYNPKEKRITIKGKKYPVTTKVIWKILKDKKK